jgi:non-heme Fe2+,alpha-ketoglutarate-dependent halogenase
MATGAGFQTMTDRFERDGYFCPIQVLDPNEAEEFRAEFFSFYTKNAASLAALSAREQASILSETHTSLPWVFELATSGRVLDAIEKVLGPNLLIWASRWFTKMPGDKTYISWHQDGTYWGLHPPNVVTAWIALSESSPANGCMRVIPGTHKRGTLPQIETNAPDNALSRGQEIAVEVDEADAVDMVLHAGEMSLHHIGIVHGSKVNSSDQPRIGIAVRYITPEVVQDGVERPVAMLVRGIDGHNHFELLQPPTSDRPGEQSRAVERMMDGIMQRRLGATSVPSKGQAG